MNVDVIIFDLDDTLYNEIEFVKSGFKAVSKYFSQEFFLDEEYIYNLLLNELHSNGRGKVFDNAFRKLGKYSKQNINKALGLYRTHFPAIILPQETVNILKYFENVPLYIVTDGNKIVQSNKIKALGLDKLVKKAFITHRYGIKHAKPSSYCFERIADIENMSYNKIVYIADNINKDFVNIKKLGFRTIRVLNGMFKDVKKDLEYQAEVEVKSICEILDILRIKDS